MALTKTNEADIWTIKDNTRTIDDQSNNFIARYNYAIWCMGQSGIIQPAGFQAKMIPIRSTHYSEQWNTRYYNHWICTLFKYFNWLIILATMVHVGFSIFVILQYHQINGNLLPFSAPQIGSLMTINNSSQPFPVFCPSIKDYNLCTRWWRIGSTTILGLMFLFWTYCFYVVCYNQMNKRKLTYGCVPVSNSEKLKCTNAFVTVTNEKFKSMVHVDFTEKIALLGMSQENHMVDLMIYKPRWWQKNYVAPARKFVMEWIWFLLCLGFSVYVLMLFYHFQ